MATDSNSSSLENQYGSSSHSTCPTESTFQNTLTGRTYSSTATNGQTRQYHESQSQLPVYSSHDHHNSQETYPPSSTGVETKANHRASKPWNADHDYYLPSTQTIYSAATTVYPKELNVELEQNGTTHSAPGHHSRRSDRNPHPTHRQTSTQPQNTSSRRHSATIQIWSKEQYPDERLRLGLPRYEDAQQSNESRQPTFNHESIDHRR